MSHATPPLILSKPVVLVGMMGAGKSSAGRKLAEKLGLRFLDCDWEIEQRTGMPIRHYFSAYGEAAFRQLEEKVMQELLHATPPAIIAAGGGTFIQPGAREAIQKNACSVWLKAGLETLAGRVLGPQLASRPLLAGADDPKAVLARLLTEREPIYGQAHVTVTVDGLRPDAVAETVIKGLQEKMKAGA